LADFGLVKAVERSVIARSTVGGVIGTPAYIAPEVWEGKEATPRTDVYALGCVLFEMVVGEPFFKGESSPVVMLAHFQPRHYPEQWPEGVPPEIEPLLERALARDPGSRYDSAREFAQDVQALVAHSTERFAGPYQALQAALAAQQWSEAQQLAQEIIAQDPAYRDVRLLARQANEGQARAERAQWAARWREQALAAAEAGQLDVAHVAIQRWLDMAPGDAEATALLEQLAAAPPEEAAPVAEPDSRITTAEAGPSRDRITLAEPVQPSVAPDESQALDKPLAPAEAAEEAPGGAPFMESRTGVDEEESEVIPPYSLDAAESPLDRQRLPNFALPVGVSLLILALLVVGFAYSQGLFPNTGTPGDQKGVVIDSIVTTRAVGSINEPLDETDTFDHASDKTIYVAIKIQHADAGTELSTHWLYEGETFFESPVATAEQEVSDVWTAFNIATDDSNPNFKQGHYHVEVYVNFELYDTAQFQVE
ncbi:MAG: serine/threonine-protein kinase, partial [Ardenticatenaceae bacterium]